MHVGGYLRISHCTVNRFTGETNDTGPAYFSTVTGCDVNGTPTLTPFMPYPDAPKHAPPTEDTLSLLLTEQRRTNTLLERLLSRPALTLHGMPEQVEESYSARQEHAMQRDEATRGMLASQNRAEG